MQSKRNVSHLLLAALVASTLGACQKNETEAGNNPAASAKPASAPAAATSEKKAEETSLTAEAFLSKITPTTCNWVTQCKNDKVKATVATMAMMVASFGSMDRPELAKQMKGVDESMKKDKRWFPTSSECTTIGNVSLQVLGLTSEQLTAKIGKTVKYDGEKAAQCIAQLSSRFKPCETELKLEKEPKLGEIDKFSNELKGDLEAHTKACEGVLTGMVEAGKACEQSFECAGEKSECKKKVCAEKKGAGSGSALLD